MGTAQVRKASKSGMSVESYCIYGGGRLSSSPELWQIHLKPLERASLASALWKPERCPVGLRFGGAGGQGRPLAWLALPGDAAGGPACDHISHEPPLLARGGDPVLATDAEQCLRNQDAIAVFSSRCTLLSAVGRANHSRNWSSNNVFLPVTCASAFRPRS